MFLVLWEWVTNAKSVYLIVFVIDPSEMGGLSLLLLAGQQAMGKSSSSSPATHDTSPPPEKDTECLAQNSPTDDDTSRLFEFAEVGVF